MRSLSKRTILLLLLFFMIICFFAISKFKKFGHNARELQKVALAATLSKTTKPVIPEEQIAFSVDRTKKLDTDLQVKEKSAEMTSPSNEDSNGTYAEFINDLQKTPVIKTCLMFEAEGIPLFKKLIESPKLFEFLVLDQKLELILLSYRLPINQALALRFDENPTLYHDMSFAFEFYQAQKELEVNLPFARQIETRGYYARVLAKILRKNPNLIGDPSVSALCNEFVNIEKSVSKDEMNYAIYGFMQRGQVKPEEIDFDPNFIPTVKVKTGEDGNKFYFAGKK